MASCRICTLRLSSVQVLIFEICCKYLRGERQVGLAPHAVEAVVDNLVGFVDFGGVPIVVGSSVLKVVAKT